MIGHEKSARQIATIRDTQVLIQYDVITSIIYGKRELLCIAFCDIFVYNVFLLLWIMFRKYSYISK